MKNDKKEYNPREVAVAILSKVHEMVKKSDLYKANSSHEIETGEEPSNDDAECPEFLADADIENLDKDGKKNKKKGEKSESSEESPDQESSPEDEQAPSSDEAPSEDKPAFGEKKPEESAPDAAPKKKPEDNEEAAPDEDNKKKAIDKASKPKMEKAEAEALNDEANDVKNSPKPPKKKLGDLKTFLMRKKMKKMEQNKKIEKMLGIDSKKEIK